MSDNTPGTFLPELDIPRETFALLQKYQELVIKWNKNINLVSNTTLESFWERHIIDCLQLLKFIKNKDIHLVDVGSGAGLPGIILSIAGVKNVTLVESDARKAAFLLQAANISSNKVNIVNDRIENINLNCDILTSRAWTNIDNILKLTASLNITDRYLLLKGESYQDELKTAGKTWKFDYTAIDSITSPNSKIIEIKDVVKLHEN